MLNLKAGELPELLNINDPERVYAIHKAYADAGCDIISANTFGANRFKYDNIDEIVKSAVKNAKRTGKKVALDIGPTGKLLKPMGDLDFEECVDIFADVVKAGRDEADLVLLETFGDLYEIKAAMLAVKENCDLPLVVSMIFDEKARLLTGADVRTACAVVEGLGADAIGFNCGLGPKQMIPLVEELEKHASIPILVMPNAGLPESVNGETIFNVDPDEFASYMTQIAKMGVSYLGGCCGTTPAHLKAMIEATKNIEDKVPEFKNETIVASYSKSVDLSEGAVIGERINPTGKKLMKEALRNKDMDYVLRQLKENPYSRRIMTNLYQFEYLHSGALDPCCYSMTYSVTKEPGEERLILNGVLNQRSQDVLAANNWNVCQYAILLMMVAQVNDMIPGELVHVIADAHIYDRHVPVIEELIKREQYPAPKVSLNPEVKDFYKFTTDDLIVEDYQAGEQIKNIPIAV